jgi:hypothetical protein
LLVLPVCGIVAVGLPPLLGEYWGEMGFIRVAKGSNALLLEEDCAWAVPKDFTTANTPCYEDGSNCV